jgi:FKBP-type peptidyl-prolyl cis-trans isomerase
MKKFLFPILLILTTGCLNSSVEEYNDTADLAFLDEYSQRDDVQETSSGLLYRVIEAGEGTSPEQDQFSFVRYEGNSVDNTIDFTTNDELDILLPQSMTTFRGLAEGVLLMNPGAIYEFVIPTNLATGDGRVFIFELELDSFLQDPEQFLEDNALNEDITETNSGLQYRVITEGEGETPEANNTVSVNYAGTYTNGYVFDESEDGPVEFGLTGVIPGFSEGIQLMTPGSTYELFLPADIGYGANPPQGILPGAVLIFEVELVEIVN